MILDNRCKHLKRVHQKPWTTPTRIHQAPLTLRSQLLSLLWTQAVFFTHGDAHNAVNHMRDCILAVPDLPNFTVAGLTVDGYDVNSIISPEWYTDAVIDMVSQVALEESSNNTVFYQQAVAITTHLGVVYIPSGSTPTYIACQMRHRNARLKLKIANSEYDSSNQPTEEWPCSRMASHHTQILFPWNPFGNHWVVVSIHKTGTISLWDSTGVANHLVLQYARLVLPLYVQLMAHRPGCG